MIPIPNCCAAISGLRDEPAFAELVRRYLKLVYFTALRQTRDDRSLAEEVAQRTFTLLAQKAPVLAARNTLAGWLHLTTRHVAAERMRAERRRQVREHAAFLMNETSCDDAADWARLRPEIDATLAELNDRDREPVLLRFFAERSFFRG